MKDRIPRIGGRVWKTGVAITLTLAITRVFHVPEPVFAAIVAIICIMPTVRQTFKYGMEQVLAVMIGAAVALVACFPYPFVRAVVAGAGAIFVMWLCVALRWFDALVLAACTVVVIIVQGEVGGDLVSYSTQRAASTIVGVLVATVVNAFIFWPRAEDKLPKRLPSIAEQAFDEFEEAALLFAAGDSEGARSAMQTWERRRSLFDKAATELTWFQDSGRLKQLLPFRHGEVTQVFAEIHATLDSIHWQANRLLKHGALSSWGDQPDEAMRSTVVKALEDCRGLRMAVVETLYSGKSTALSESGAEYAVDCNSMYEGHMQHAAQAMSERGPYPVFETAKLGVELVNYICFLNNLRDVLIENERLLSRLKKNV